MNRALLVFRFLIGVISLLSSCVPKEGIKYSVSVDPTLAVETESLTNLKTTAYSTMHTPSIQITYETPSPHDNNSSQSITLTPTHICSGYYESDVTSFLPTSTPTYMEYSNEEGDIFITLTRAIYFVDEQNYCWDRTSSDFNIIIERGTQHYVLSGVEIFRKLFPMDPYYPASGITNFENILIQDLDLDGEDELVWNIDIIGAYCCTSTVVLYYDTTEDIYKPTNGITNKFSEAGRLLDVDDDGIPEIITRDTSLGYAFGASTALNAITPLVIYQFENQSLVNVTKEYPEVVMRDAQEWLDFFTTNNDPNIQVFALAAYVADMVLIDKEEEGWKLFEQKCGTISSEDYCLTFKEHIKKILTEHDYH